MIGGFFLVHPTIGCLSQTQAGQGVKKKSRCRFVMTQTVRPSLVITHCHSIDMLDSVQNTCAETDQAQRGTRTLIGRLARSTVVHYGLG